MQIKVMVVELNGRLVKAPEGEKQPFKLARYDPNSFEGTVVLSPLQEDGAPAYWEPLDLNIKDLAAFNAFRYGQIRTLTISDADEEDTQA